MLVGMARLSAAANWEVSPVRMVLTPSQQTAAITVRNNGDEASTLQIGVVAWSQRDGRDVYIPTRELLVSPPIATIAAQGEQVIRAALRRPADAVNELSFRINLQELPAQLMPGTTGVQVALRVGLPVFVQSVTGTAAPELTARIARVSATQLKLELRNRGSAHIEVSDFAVFLPGDERAIAHESVSRYLLAGQARDWVMDIEPINEPRSKRLHLKAYTDAGDFDTEIAVDTP